MTNARAFDFGVAFFVACYRGDIPGAQRYIDKHGAREPPLRDALREGKEVVFRRTLQDGHFPMAKWIYELGGVDLHAGDDLPMREVGYGGDLAQIHWMWTLGAVTPGGNTPQYLFRNACMYGHLPMAQWVLELYGWGSIPMDAATTAFALACERRHEAVAKWVWAVLPKPIPDYVLPMALRWTATGGGGGGKVAALPFAIMHWLCDECGADPHALDLVLPTHADGVELLAFVYDKDPEWPQYSSETHAYMARAGQRWSHTRRTWTLAVVVSGWGLATRRRAVCSQPAL